MWNPSNGNGATSFNTLKWSLELSFAEPLEVAMEDGGGGDPDCSVSP